LTEARNSVSSGAWKNETFPTARVYRATHAYAASSEDELSLKVGQLLSVSQTFKDGWASASIDKLVGVVPLTHIVAVAAAEPAEPAAAPSAACEPSKSPPRAAAAAPAAFSIDAVTRILAEQAINDEALWSGEAKAYRVLHQFKHELLSLSSSMSPECTVWVYVQETLMPKSDQLLVFTFRVKAKDKVRAFLAHAHRTLKIAMPVDKCSLETESGYRLRSNECMATYGLGTLLSSWRLELRERPKAHLYDVVSMPPALAVPETTTHLVEFCFPPLVELRGMQKKVLKVDVTLPLSVIIADICARFGLSDASRFCLCTVDLQPNIQLDESVPLLSYGVGTHFTSKLVLALNFKTVARGESIHNDSMFSVYRFAQFPSAQIQSDDAKAIIRYLDAALATVHATVDNERNKRAAAESRARLLAERVDKLTRANRKLSAGGGGGESAAPAATGSSPSKRSSPLSSSPPDVPALPAPPGLRAPPALPETATMQADLTRGIAARMSALARTGAANTVVFEPPPPLLAPPQLRSAAGSSNTSSGTSTPIKTSSGRRRRRHTNDDDDTDADAGGADVDVFETDADEDDEEEDEEDGAAGGFSSLLQAVLAGRKKDLHTK
jgi:hypothetical protein